MMQLGDFPRTICGKLLDLDDLEIIRRIIDSNPSATRAQISRDVCLAWSWLKPDGGLKDMSCRVLLLKLHRSGMNTPLPGAQVRYLIDSPSGYLCAIGFSAAAWKVGPRDSWIGWSAERRVQNLHLVVDNSRFLILPWVQCKHLASKILSLCAKRLPVDWQDIYGYRPVLMETFVEKDRFAGTCYKAANWIHVGSTQGRGKLDRFKEYKLPVKDIYLYPLDKTFRLFLV